MTQPVHELHPSGNLKTKIHALECAEGGVSVFQDGVFVTQVTSLLPEGARSYVVSRINLMGQDKCELSMDHNRMFWKTDHLQNIKRVISAKNLHRIVRQRREENPISINLDGQSFPRNNIQFRVGYNHFPG